MAATITLSKNIAKQLLARKRRVQDYLKRDDAARKPADVTFVKPFTIPADGK